MKKFILPLIEIIKVDENQIIATSGVEDVEMFGPSDIPGINWPKK